MSNAYKHNHYVPQWYQRRFLPAAGEKKFFYLDLHPERFVDAKGVTRTKTALQRWGTGSCFAAEDLYTTQFGQWESTEIEERFFGRIDREGKAAIEFFDRFRHTLIDTKAFHRLLTYLSVQKLRTPKGLAYVGSVIGNAGKNQALMAMQDLQSLHCVIWSEAVLEPVGNNGEEAKTWLKTSSEKWRQLIHAANLHD